MAKRTKVTLSDISAMPAAFIMKNLGFFAFLGFVATLYIASVHYANGNVLRIQVLQKEIKEMRWYYMSLQSENMVKSMQSEVANRVLDDGLRLQRGKTKKITIDKQ